MKTAILPAARTTSAVGDAGPVRSLDRLADRRFHQRLIGETSLDPCRRPVDHGTQLDVPILVPGHSAIEGMSIRRATAPGARLGRLVMLACASSNSSTRRRSSIASPHRSRTYAAHWSGDLSIAPKKIDFAPGAYVIGF